MDFNMTVTLLTLAGAIILLVGNVIRNDMVAILIILVLISSGVLQVPEALSGFSSAAVIVIACMFIVGKAIVHTGIASRVGDAILKYGGTGERRLLIMIMAAAGCVGAFMSSTATAAIFIPITLTVADKASINHKRLLMPLAVASLISGMMTLVATTPNIVINSALRDLNLAPLSFFSFTPFGVLILILAMGFMVLFGQNMLAPKGSLIERKKEPCIDDLLQYHKLAKDEYLLRIPKGSALAGRSVTSMQLNALYRVILLGVQTHEGGRKKDIVAAQPDMIFNTEDILLVIGSPDHIATFINKFSLQQAVEDDSQRRAFFQEVGVAEVMLNPDSSLIGKSLKETMFQSLFHIMALGIRRKGNTITEDIADIPLKAGDVLFVCGAWKEIVRLKNHKDHYLLLTMPQDYKEVIPAKNKEKTALIILAGMVGLMVFNVAPPVTAILAATTALLFTRCVPITSIYDVVDWQTIVMTAGILSLALALQKTGVFTLISAGFLETFSGASPLLILTGLFLVTTCLGLVISNTAVAVLVAPMALEVGLKFSINPQACALITAIGCSAAFISPLGSTVHMIVREPGGYSLQDYVKVGVPLLLLTLCATLFLCWLIYLH